jgi:hypothetical protein
MANEMGFAKLYNELEKYLKDKDTRYIQKLFIHSKILRMPQS